SHFRGLETVLLNLLRWHFQVPPEFFQQLFFNRFSAWWLIAPVVLTALAQSFRQFRRAQPQRFALAKYLVILGAIAFVVAFWATDLELSIQSSMHPLLAR